jgi:aerobic carbon-monoxide dehydrogenase small subunit
VKFVLNGKPVDVRAHPMKRLLDVLREDCGLTGTKEGCGEGECGACTILLDGQPVNACLVPFAHVHAARVTTIEGIRGRRGLQEAFVREGATQCGLCTPGLIVAASTLPSNATLDQVRLALAGNICRCTGYGAIYRAINSARGRRKSPAGSGLQKSPAGSGLHAGTRRAAGPARKPGHPGTARGPARTARLRSSGGAKRRATARQPSPSARAKAGRT